MVEALEDFGRELAAGLAEGLIEHTIELIEFGLQGGARLIEQKQDEVIEGQLASAGKVLRLLAVGRDEGWTIKRTVVTEHFSRIVPLPEPLVSLPIVESQLLITTGLYCPRTAWGRAMAAHIDAAVRRLARAPEALLALYSAGERAAYEDQLRDYFRARVAAQFPGIEPPLQ